jgi:hypothetical protein
LATPGTPDKGRKQTKTQNLKQHKKSLKIWRKKNMLHSYCVSILAFPFENVFHNVLEEGILNDIKWSWHVQDPHPDDCQRGGDGCCSLFYCRPPLATVLFAVLISMK